MAQYSTDFSEYTLSSAPSDWTNRWNTTGNTHQVVAGGGIRGKVYSIATTTADESGFSWNDIDADGNRANVEILMRAQSNDATKNPTLAAFARGSGASGAEYTVYGRVRGDTDLLGCAQIRAGAGTTPGTGTPSSSYTPVADTWYWMRMQLTTDGINQNYFKVRIWTGALSDEPGTWPVDASSTWVDLVSPGWVGIFSREAQTVLVDYFAVGTGGDAAPGPSIGLTSHTVTSIAATTATIGITSDATDGTLYWYISESATPPSEADLKAGTGASGGAYGSIGSPVVGANTAAVTGLSANTTYYRHWFQEATAYKSSISTSTSFTTLSGVGEDPALRLDALSGSRLLLDTDTGSPRTVASAEYIVLGGTAGSRTITKQGTVAISSGSMADITDAGLATVGATYKVILIAGNDDQGIYDSTVVDRNA